MCFLRISIFRVFQIICVLVVCSASTFADSPGAAKAYGPDWSGTVTGYVTAIFSNPSSIVVESADRSAALTVVSAPNLVGLAIGAGISVTGTMQSDGTLLRLSAFLTGQSMVVSPVGLPNKSVTGTAGNAGLATLDMLVTTWGKVVENPSTYADGSIRFRITDGSSDTNGPMYVQVVTPASVGVPVLVYPNDYVTATGIAGQDAGSTRKVTVRYLSEMSRLVVAPDSHRLPAAGDTPWYNGSVWVADSTLFNNGANIGIGTTTPGAMLNIKNDGQQLYLQQSNADNGWKIAVDNADGYLKFKRRQGSPASDNTRLWVAPGGNVIIPRNLNVTGAIYRAGGGLRTGGYVTRPDYIIYKDDADGYYKGFRTSDGVVTHSDPTDAAAVINGVLNSYGRDLAIYTIPVPPNFREGRTIQLKEGVFNCYQTVVIPPSEDFIFDAGSSKFVDCIPGGGDLVFVDSGMDCTFKFGILLTNHSNSVSLRIRPQNNGPDSFVCFTSCSVYVNSVIGPGDGLVLDPSTQEIDQSEFKVVDQAVAATATGIRILGGHNVWSCQFHIVGNRFASTSLAVPNNTMNNRFTGHMPIINGVGGYNIFNATGTVQTLTFNSSNSRGKIRAASITTINNSAGGTTRVMTSSGDSYY